MFFFFIFFSLEYDSALRFHIEYLNVAKVWHQKKKMKDDIIYVQNVLNTNDIAHIQLVYHLNE